jgi:hypothetical protein
MEGLMDRLMDGWLDVKAVLRIANSNKQDWLRPVSKIAVSIMVVNG